MKRKLALLTALLIAPIVFLRAADATASKKPNIVFILGYGDVQCLNPQRGKIATPNLEKLAGQGMTFTDAHSSSSVCTPTPYSILTRRYNWRTHLQSGVLNGYTVHWTPPAYQFIADKATASILNALEQKAAGGAKTKAV